MLYEVITCSGCLAVIFKDHYVSETWISLKVKNTIFIGLEYQSHLVDTDVTEILVMIRRFDNDFVSTNAVHHIVEPFSLLIELTLNNKCRVFVRYHPHLPISLRVAGTVSRKR